MFEFLFTLASFIWYILQWILTIPFWIFVIVFFPFIWIVMTVLGMLWQLFPAIFYTAKETINSIGTYSPRHTNVLYGNMQPAKKNYFFGAAYAELGRTIRSTVKSTPRFANVVRGEFTTAAAGLKSDLRDIVHEPLEVYPFWYSSFLDSLWDFTTFGGFGCGRFIITCLVCTVISLLHVIVLVIITLGAYIIFGFLFLADSIYSLINGISSNCGSCQHRFVLPHYKCPKCGVVHTKLKPGRYGIWTRTCQCGAKLPTTFLNGREKLESHCPVCGDVIEDGGKHVDICIPIVGGTRSGKTCFVTQAVTNVGNNASAYGLEYKNFGGKNSDYEDNRVCLDKNMLPDKTRSSRLSYFRFYLTPKERKIKNLIALCDVAGEVYSSDMAIAYQSGYRYANAFLLVVDPLTVSGYRRTISNNLSFNFAQYGASMSRIDAVVGRLVGVLQNIFSIKATDMLKTDVAVVFTKGDIPGLSDLIGDSAVKKYMSANPGVNKYDAQNAVCEKFLIDNGEANFVNTVKSSFKSVQFFTSSALGHTANGKPFVAEGVEDPVLWLIDKACKNIDLKDKWGRKI